MTSTYFATTAGSGDSIGDGPLDDVLGRRFDSLVAGLAPATRPRGVEVPMPRRRPTATRRGPIAAPVRRQQRPAARTTGVAAPRLSAAATRAAVRHDARAVRPESAAASRPRPAAATWQLTDRGIAVVMIVGLVLMIASAVAIVSTAITVTSEDHRPVAGVHQST